MDLESNRLAALRDYRVLDTLSDESLDGLTRLAASICEAPVALISLIDENRQWFLSRLGIELQETARDISFCSHAIQQDALLEVEDARKDLRFADNPLVLGAPHVRFYAGAPIITEEGYRLGTLCVMDQRARTLSPFQRESLRILGRQVLTQLELRRKTHQQQELSERLRVVTENARVGLMVVDSKKRLVYENAAFQGFFEDSASLLEGVSSYLDRALSGDPAQLEFPLHGRHYFLSFQLNQASGERSVIGVVTEVTQQKLQQMALVEQNSQLQTVLTAAEMGVWFWDCLDNTLRTIQGSGPLSGLPPQLYPNSAEALQRLVHPDDWQPLVDRVRQAVEGDVFVHKFRVVSATSKLRWVAVQGQVRRDAQGQIIGISGVDQDVTERQSYLVRVEHLNRVYSVLSDINQIIAREKNAERLLEASCRVAVTKGRFLGAWIGLIRGHELPLVVAMQGESGVDAAEPLSEAALERLRQCQIYVENELPGGQGYRSLAVLPLQAALEVKGCLALYSDEANFFEADELRLLTELASDITFGLERLRVQEALLESEMRFRQLADNIDTVFWMVDNSKGELLYVSPAYEKIWGSSAQDLYREPRSWLDRVHPEDFVRVRDASMSGLVPGEYDEVYRIVRPDGRVRWIHDQGFPVQDSQGNLVRVVGTAEDITDQYLLEEQLRQSQKMEAVGQLAGGVAHDFNNLLAVILMQAELAQASPEDTAEMLDEIVRAAERAADLTRQLLAFSRRQVIQRRQLDLNQVVENLAHMLRRILGDQIRLQLELEEQGLWTLADSSMVDQILLNLAVNARDALDEGGLLEISTSRFHLPGDTPEAAAGDYVCLGVQDDGRGMSPEVMDHIFEPFFSTKEQTKGTGLGLSTVFGIVKQHDGFINVTSELGRGTRFDVYLPALPPEQVVAEERTHPAPSQGGGHEAILLVEDDEGVRRLTGQVLRAAGYQVWEATDGLAALEIWQEHRQRFQLLVTDIVMPEGLSGLQLAARLQQERGDLRVLLISGYSSEFSETEQALSAGQAFLAKPATSQRLLDAVRSLLDER